MEFYDSISRHYDLIFPLQKKQVGFVLSKSQQDVQNQNLLDIGCGTGNLAIALAPHFCQIEAIDLDGEMLDLARQKSLASNLNFKEQSMLELQQEYQHESFDVVCCFGNTLVHLSRMEEVREFVEQAYKVLKQGGKFLIQIINYDKVLDQNVDHLATIENEGIHFVRNYSYDQENHKILFNTILTKDDTDLRIENTIPLLPIRPSELNDLLTNTGFREIEMYGNFAMSPFEKDSVPYVLSCKKL